MSARAFWLTVAATAIGGVVTLLIYDWIKGPKEIRPALNSTVRG